MTRAQGAAPPPGSKEPVAAGDAPVLPRFPLSLGQVQARSAVAQQRAQPGAKPQQPRTAAKAVLRPQLHLQHAQAATEQAARHSGPAGLGLDSAAVRQRMVHRLVAEGIGDERVLQAFARVQRHLFVDSALVGQAYEDTSLPIGLSQTISKPSVVARMLSLLMAGDAARQQGHLGRVLEIGTGCGYQAALLCLLGRSVVSIERLQALHERARTNLEGLRGHSLRLVHGDGRLGHAPRAPYDCIIAAAGGEALPDEWLQQLAPGGRLVAPMQGAGTGQQVLMVVDHRADGMAISRHELVNFVPLKSGVA